MKKENFILNYKKYFFHNNQKRLTFDMADNVKAKKRLTQAIERFKIISNFLFSGKEVWILLIIWDAKGENKQELLRSGFLNTLENSTKFYSGSLKDGLIDESNFDSEALEECEILYINFDNYNFDTIYPIVYSKAGFDLALENTAGLIAYFISFDEEPVFLNFYDFRGMEFLTNDQGVIDVVSNKYNDFLLK